MEAGKQRLLGDTQRIVGNQEVPSISTESELRKQLMAVLSLKDRVLKMSLLGREDDCSDEVQKVGSNGEVVREINQNQ